MNRTILISFLLLGACFGACSYNVHGDCDDPAELTVADVCNYGCSENEACQGDPDGECWAQCPTILTPCDGGLEPALSCFETAFDTCSESSKDDAKTCLLALSCVEASP